MTTDSTPVSPPAPPDQVATFERALDLFLLAAVLLGLGGALWTWSRTPPVPVLLFHDVAPTRAAHDFWTLHPDRFLEIADRLATLGRTTLSLEQVRAMCDGQLGADRAARSMVITIDDGAASARDLVGPALAARGLRGQFFVVSLWTPPAHLDRAAARDLEAAGHEIGSHGATHDSLLAGPGDPAREELRVLAELYSSRKTLGEWLGHPVNAVAYPRGEVDARVVQLARRVHYDLGYTTELGYLEVGTPPLEIPRYQLNWDTTAEQVEDYVQGPARQRQREAGLLLLMGMTAAGTWRWRRRRLAALPAA